MATKQQEVEVLESWEEIEETDVITPLFFYKLLQKTLLYHKNPFLRFSVITYN